MAYQAYLPYPFRAYLPYQAYLPFQAFPSRPFRAYRFRPFQGFLELEQAMALIFSDFLQDGLCGHPVTCS